MTIKGIGSASVLQCLFVVNGAAENGRDSGATVLNTLDATIVCDAQNLTLVPT